MHTQRSVTVSTDLLIKCLTPGIGADKQGELKKPFRPLFESEAGVDDGFIGKVELTQSEVKRILVDNKPCIALLATYHALEDNSLIGGEVNVLALFRIKGGKPELIDAADVTQDRFCSLSPRAVLRYKTGTDALVVVNSHFNSAENFCILSPVALIDGKLTELCKDVPILYGCRNGEASMGQDGRFLLGKADGAPLVPMTFSIKTIYEKYNPDNPGKAIFSETKTFNIPFVRRKKDYVTNKKAKAKAALEAYMVKTGFEGPG